MEVLKKDLPGCLLWESWSGNWIHTPPDQTNQFRTGPSGPDAQRSYFYHLVYANIPKYDACQILYTGIAET